MYSSLFQVEYCTKRNYSCWWTCLVHLLNLNTQTLSSSPKIIIRCVNIVTIFVFICKYVTYFASIYQSLCISLLSFWNMWSYTVVFVFKCWLLWAGQLGARDLFELILLAGFYLNEVEQVKVKSKNTVFLGRS